MLYIRDGFLLVLKAKQFLHSRWEEVMCAFVNIYYLHLPTFRQYSFTKWLCFPFQDGVKMSKKSCLSTNAGGVGGNRRIKCILGKPLIEQIWLCDIRTKCKDIMKQWYIRCEATNPPKGIIRSISYCLLLHGVKLSYATFYWTATKRC